MAEKKVHNDFSKGNIPSVVMRMALPLIAAQLVNVLYNVVDRIYIGHIPGVGSMALTGVGIALPVISILSAFAGLFGQGGAPLCSMARGRGDNDEAARVMGNAFSMLLVSSVSLGLLTWAFLDPVIAVFAAGKEASSYAREYLAVYLIGTTFSFVSLGMNVYINAQGFAGTGMLTVVIGARHAHSAARRSSQYRARPAVHFRISHGCARCGGRHGALAGAERRVVLPLSAQR